MAQDRIPQHHVPDDVLIAYASGSLSASQSLLVATHLTLCPLCRARVEQAEAVGAALMMAAVGDEAAAVGASLTGTPGPAAAPVATAPSTAPGQLVTSAGAGDSAGDSAFDDQLISILGKIDEEEARAGMPEGAPSRLITPGHPRLDQSPESTPAVDPTGIVPAPLFALIGSLEEAPWYQATRSLAVLDVPSLPDEKLVKLIRLAPGSRVPNHAHPGAEATLVLTGGFTDDAGHYRRGDLSLRDNSANHAQEIDSDEPCIWLLVADGPHIPRSLIGWLARIFRGI